MSAIEMIDLTSDEEMMVEPNRHADESEDEPDVEVSKYQLRDLEDLHDKGYCVIPIFTDLTDMDGMVEGIAQAASQWPEFANCMPKAVDLTIFNASKVLADGSEGPKYVCGGFGALANPGSFHSLAIRFMRRYIDLQLRNYFWYEYERKYLIGDGAGRMLFSQCIDRFMCRAIGDVPSKESWHRDEAKGAAAGEHIFGGWINLNHFNQSFSCVPGTHMPGVNFGGGFNTKDISKAQAADYKRRAVKVNIPPGHILIFYENIMHEVVGKAIKETMLRLFTGWRFSRSSSPLNMSTAALKKILDDNAVVPIKSGQIPPMWPKLYTVNWKGKMRSWSQMMFQIPDPVTDHRLISYPKGVMKSYQEMGYEKCPAYTPAEFRLYCPTTIG